jgi:hypothetical protein
MFLTFLQNTVSNKMKEKVAKSMTVEKNVNLDLKKESVQKKTFVQLFTLYTVLHSLFFWADKYY